MLFKNFPYPLPRPIDKPHRDERLEMNKAKRGDKFSEFAVVQDNRIPVDGSAFVMDIQIRY